MIYSTEGARIRIGAVLAMKAAEFVTADFTTALTAAVVIGEPETISGTGDEFSPIEFTGISDGRTKTLKGPRKAMAITLTHGADYADTGQIAVRAAFLARDDYAFEIEWADKPATGAAPKNSKRQFIAKVMGINETLDAAGNVTKLVITLQPNSNIVSVNASAT